MSREYTRNGIKHVFLYLYVCVYSVEKERNGCLSSKLIDLTVYENWPPTQSEQSIPWDILGVIADKPVVHDLLCGRFRWTITTALQNVVTFISHKFLTLRLSFHHILKPCKRFFKLNQKAWKSSLKLNVHLTNQNYNDSGAILLAP